MSPRQPNRQQNVPPRKTQEEEIIDIPLPYLGERRMDTHPGPPWITEEGFVVTDRRSHHERRKNWH